MTLAALHRELIPAAIPMSVFMRWWQLYKADPSIFPGSHQPVKPQPAKRVKPQSVDEQLSRLRSAAQ